MATGLEYDACEASKCFFLKKEAKTFARLSPGSPRQPRKVFWFFFQKRTICFPGRRRSHADPAGAGWY
jgi:hypothetical protein